jgi:hypothetical protein
MKCGRNRATSADWSRGSGDLDRPLCGSFDWCDGSGPFGGAMLLVTGVVRVFPLFMPDVKK